MNKWKNVTGVAGEAGAGGSSWTPQQLACPEQKWSFFLMNS